MSFGKIVEHRDRVPFIEKNLRANTADVAGPADDENLHRARWGALPRRVKANNVRQPAGSGLLLEPCDHPPDQAIFSARVEDLEALLFRAPFNNVDVDMPHAPLPHRASACFV